MLEKRRLLNMVFSHSTWKDGKLTANHRKPFDSLALTNIAHQQQKADLPDEDGLFEFWLPFVDAFRTGLTTHSEEIFILFGMFPQEDFIDV